MKITKAVIPAAGLGTRFLPQTIAQPKEMLPIIDKPVIQFVVEEAVAAGIKDILIITGRSKRTIEDHFDPSWELLEKLSQGRKKGLAREIQKIANMAHFHFVRQKTPRGLGDAIYQARYHVDNKPFVVLLGDTIIGGPANYCCVKELIKIYEKCEKSIVAVEKVAKDKVERYGIIKRKIESEKRETNNDIEVENLVEKPKAKDAPSDLAIAARYVFTPEIFDLIKKTKPGKNDEIQITDSMKQLAKDGKLIAHQIKGKRYDIGSRLDYVEAFLELGMKRGDIGGKIRKIIKELLSL